MEFNLNKIQDIAAEYTNECLKNKVAQLGDLKLFDNPLLAVADTKDPLFFTIEHSFIKPEGKANENQLSIADDNVIDLHF